MKRALLFGLAAAGSIALATLSACKKESITKGSATASSSVRSQRMERLPDIVFTGTVGYACGNIAPCAIGLYVPVRRNKVTLTKTNTTASLYPNLRYTFYKKINPTTYVPIAQYTCSSSNVSYANLALPDNTSIYVVANLPTSPAPDPSYNLIFSGGFLTNDPGTWGIWGDCMFTTQSHNGDPC
jgi:hypothetical protein